MRIKVWFMNILVNRLCLIMDKLTIDFPNLHEKCYLTRGDKVLELVDGGGVCTLGIWFEGNKPQ